jgi:hypothetical protein
LLSSRVLQIEETHAKGTHAVAIDNILVVPVKIRGRWDAMVVAHATMAWGHANHMRLSNGSAQLLIAMVTYV